MADEPTKDVPETDPEGLGDAGKKALEAERKAKRDAEKAAKAAEKKAEDAEARLAKLETDAKSDTDKAIDAARKEAADQARSEERSKWQQVVLDATVAAKAAQKLADPDFARLIDLDGIEVAEDGTIKGDLDGAIDRLLKEKPALAATAGTRASIDQGAQGGPSGESAEESFGRQLAKEAGFS